MSHISTAGRLLECLNAESPALRDAVASAAGLNAERANAAMTGAVVLSLSEQLRLSEAAAVLAPGFTPHALRLRGRALAARSTDTSDAIDPRRDLNNDPWERAAQQLRG
jgi:hypothetical protein